jgi:hypothetical protein
LPANPHRKSPLSSASPPAAFASSSKPTKRGSIVTAVVNERLDLIVELFDRSLEVIGHAMRAKLRSKDGTIIGTDHYARLATVSKLIKILTVGRPIPRAPEPKREEEGIIDYGQLRKIVEAKLQKLEEPK